MLTDPLLSGTRALVIDGNPAQRRATVLQLRDLGVHQVRTCRGLADAKASLEQVDVDFVLCCDSIEGSELSGQHLLEELRRNALLPYATVFVMLASEATYVTVTEAAEAALDSYLLRPYRVSDLAERLRVARRRKRELGAIFGAIERQQFDEAITLCLDRHAANQPYGQHCARIAGELMLRSGRTGDALLLFRQLERDLKTPWARLGVARALLAAGDAAAARRQTEQLLRQQPMMAEAYDVLTRLLVDQGELKLALQTSHTVSEITPGCLLRQQHCGTLAFYLGDRELAVQMLERAVALGARSRLFDALSLMLLALMRSDMGDSRRLALMHEALKQYLRWYPGSRRLQRFVSGAGALRALAAHQLDEAQTEVLALGGAAGEDDFDLEAANLVLALWVRLPERDVAAGQQDAMVRQIALRFSVSKAITDILVASARHHAVVTATIRTCQADITAVAEEAMRLSLQDDHQAAVQLLLARGADTRNARLIELAGMLLHRHGPRVPDHDRLLADARQLYQRHCRPITHIAGMRRSGRQPGSLLLRGQAFGPAVDPDPMQAPAATTPQDLLVPTDSRHAPLAGSPASGGEPDALALMAAASVAATAQAQLA